MVHGLMYILYAFGATVLGVIALALYARYKISQQAPGWYSEGPKCAPGCCEEKSKPWEEGQE